MVANTIMVLHRAGALTGSLIVDGFLGARVQPGARLSSIVKVRKGLASGAAINPDTTEPDVACCRQI